MPDVYKSEKRISRFTETEAKLHIYNQANLSGKIAPYAEIKKAAEALHSDLHWQIQLQIHSLNEYIQKENDWMMEWEGSRRTYYSSRAIVLDNAKLQACYALQNYQKKWLHLLEIMQKINTSQNADISHLPHLVTKLLSGMQQIEVLRHSKYETWNGWDYARGEYERENGRYVTRTRYTADIGQMSRVLETGASTEFVFCEFCRASGPKGKARHQEPCTELSSYGYDPYTGKDRSYEFDEQNHTYDPDQNWSDLAGGYGHWEKYRKYFNFYDLPSKLRFVPTQMTAEIIQNFTQTVVKEYNHSLKIYKLILECFNSPHLPNIAHFNEKLLKADPSNTNAIILFHYKNATKSTFNNFFTGNVDDGIKKLKLLSNNHYSLASFLLMQIYLDKYKHELKKKLKNSLKDFLEALEYGERFLTSKDNPITFRGQPDEIQFAKFKTRVKDNLINCISDVLSLKTDVSVSPILEKIESFKKRFEIEHKDKRSTSSHATLATPLESKEEKIESKAEKKSDLAPLLENKKIDKLSKEVYPIGTFRKFGLVEATLDSSSSSKDLRPRI